MIMTRKRTRATGEHDLGWRVMPSIRSAPLGHRPTRNRHGRVGRDCPESLMSQQDSTLSLLFLFNPYSAPKPQ